MAEDGNEKILGEGKDNLQPAVQLRKIAYGLSQKQKGECFHTTDEMRHLAMF